MPMNNITEPKNILVAYYKALYAGKLEKVKELMTWESYTMTLESFGLKLALKDKNFKSLLKKIDNAEALGEVEAQLSQELVSRDKNPKIEILSVEMNGLDRQTVYYLEDGKDKVLYFSKEKNEWKIDYYAGRKVA